MHLSEQKLDWEILQPTLLQPELLQQNSTNLESQKENIHFFDLQPRASRAIRQFLQNSHRTLLVLKSDAQAEYASAVENFIKSQKSPLQISGVQYHIEQADSFSFARIYTEPAISFSDNFAAKQSVASALYFDKAQLFGSVRIHPTSQDIQLNAGLVHQLNNGVLILSAASLLEQFDCWARLKQILLTGQFDWYSAHPFKTLPCEIPSYPLTLKVILLGNRDELATLAELETELYQLADYSEIESYIAVETPEQQNLWKKYVQAFAEKMQFPGITDDGLTKLYQFLVRESENRLLINGSPQKLKQILSEVVVMKGEDSPLNAVDFSAFFKQQAEQYGFLREQAYADIFNHQVRLETDGEMIGQINGLSVIEFAGTPISFGEPSRISCLVQFGDGEVIDIERKSELAGNIHGKGMMIAESCLANLLELPSQLPFSASLVFEQSYGEVDGDSASLAAFLALVSALSDLPIPQSIAVTGTIDQFGLVNAVGGVNDKIEGFFAVCQGRGLNGKQGVIIPESCIQQLSLNDDVVSAVKNQQFFIYGVSDLFDACEIIFARPFFNEEENPSIELSISELIQQRLSEHSEPQSFLPFWIKWFRKK